MGELATEQGGSRTAALVCQGRAAAHGRIAPDRFADPTAMPLLRPAEQAEVALVRDGTPPRELGARMRYEMIRGGAPVVAARTVALDDALAESLAPQVVILGAGLDGRAWRLPALAGRFVCEVDQPRSQRDKIDRAAALPADRAPHFVPAELGRDRLADGLAAAGHQADVPTTWVCEGVVPYLTGDQVAATVAEVAACSAPGSRLIVNYQAPSRLGDLYRKLIAVVAATRKSNPWATEPWRSAWTPQSMAALLGKNGFTVRRDDDLLATATALGGPIGQRGPLHNSRFTVADR
jgi:methyltransferase (TIGR00027 family)